MNVKGWFPLGLTGLISLQSKGLSRVFSNTTVQKHQFSALSLLYGPTLTCVHDYWKNHSFTIWTFVGKVMCLLFNMMFRFITVFLPRSKVFLNFMAVILDYSDFGAQENRICHCFHFFPFYLSWSDETRCHDLSFLNVEFSASFFHSPLPPSSKGFLVCLHFLPLEWYHLHIWDCWYFSQKSWFQLVIHPAWHFAWCNLHIS